MVAATACVMFGLGGAAFDPAGGEVVLCRKIAALGVEIAGSPYQETDRDAIIAVLTAAHAKGHKLIIGGDSLGANNAPAIAAAVRHQMGVDYIFGFQPSLYGGHNQISPNVIRARCIYNPNFFETGGLGAYKWEPMDGNARTKLAVITTTDFHPGDDDVAMQQLVLNDITRIIAS